jgi:signal transduction histidine kinase
MTTDTADAPGRHVSLDQASAALWAIRVGGGDISTHQVAVSPAVRAAIAPLVVALRWGAVLFGMVFAAPASFDGDMAVVGSVAVALWWTSWRSFRPLPLASDRTAVRAFLLVDAIVFGVAAGLSGGPVSPLALTMVVAGIVGAVGWGLVPGLLALFAAFAASHAVALVGDTEPELGSLQSTTIMVGAATAVALVAFLRAGLVEADRRRRALSSQIEHLGETNDLLVMLNQAARTVPGALDEREVAKAMTEQLRAAFNPTSLAVLQRGAGDSWATIHADNSTIPAIIQTDRLPAAARTALGKSTAIRAVRCEALHPEVASVLAVPLVARNEPIGVVLLGHTQEGTWQGREVGLLDRLAEILALSLDNVRRYAQLRSTTATAERERIARELHDRLGQMLTYVALELERAMESTPSPELDQVYDDVQRSITELRETLRQLRTNVSKDRSFAEVARDLVGEFGARHGVVVHLDLDDVGQPASPGVEQQLLRILQEALNNVAKHAGAASVRVRYGTGHAGQRLTIVDDGCGFDTDGTRRDDAWGVIGMHERAASIDARLMVTSSPGLGTTVQVDRGEP